jgi:uncharacterized protein DUF6152
MKKIIAAWIGTIAVLTSAGLLSAHHSLAQFDTTKAVRVKGVVVMFERINPHSIIFLDQKLADGETLRWAVDGPHVAGLVRKGFEKDTLKVGDVVEVCGYVPKAGADPKLATATVPLGLNVNGIPPKISGRRMNGELLITPDGQKHIWSDYGEHLCLDKDFHDFHK